MLRAQASSLLGQAEALMGLTNDDDFLTKAIKDLAKFEENEDLGSNEPEFKKAHLRIMEIAPKIKDLVASLNSDKKEKFDRKAEKKVNRAQLNHFNKL